MRRLTWDDGLEQLDGWSRDGRWIYFSSTSRDIAGMNDIFRVSADGGTPMPVSEERYVNEFGAARVARRANGSRSSRAASRRISGGAAAAATSISPSCGR